MSNEPERLVHPVDYKSASYYFGSISDDEEDCAGEEADLMDLTCDDDISLTRWAQSIIRILLKDPYY